VVAVDSVAAVVSVVETIVEVVVAAVSVAIEAVVSAAIVAVAAFVDAAVEVTEIARKNFLVVLRVRCHFVFGNANDSCCFSFLVIYKKKEIIKHRQKN
jgi:hypothetical protein